MLKIKTLTVGQLATNCYLVIDDKTGQTLIIDPGDDADYIMGVISDLHTEPKLIIATHGHFDHILAVTELKLAFKIPFLMSQKDEFLLSRMQNSAPPPKIDKYLKDKDKLAIGHWSLVIISTPGHTPGSLSFYSPKEKILFCGDLVFAEGGLGRTDFVYSSQEDLTSSLAKISKLPKDTKVFSGHGNETTIGEIKLYNKGRYS